MSKSKLVLIMAVLFLIIGPATLVLDKAEAAVASGTAVISDGARDGPEATNGTITYVMADVPAPAAGTVLVGWLISDDGSVKLNTGAMTVAGDGSIHHHYNSPTGDDLIAAYDKVAITVEAEADAEAAAPGGPIAYSHAVPNGAMVHIRHLVSLWAQPEDTTNGILTNLKEQLDVAILHANLAGNATDIAGVRQHIEHVINAIEGMDGANYGDLDGNGAVQDFGDGYGAIPHAINRTHGPFAAGGAADDDVVVSGANLVDVTGKNAEDWAGLARDQALAALATDSLALAKVLLGPGVDTVVTRLQAARWGFDTDGDGTIESIAGEGGAVQAFVEAQKMATYTLETGGFEAAAGEAAAGSGPGIGLPSVGDPTIPAMAQAALIAGFVLLSTGGALVLRRRRSRTDA